MKILSDGAMGIVTTAVVIVAGLLVLSGLQGSLTANSAEYNATSTAITGLSVFPDYFSTIAIIIVAVFILALITGFGRQGSM